MNTRNMTLFLILPLLLLSFAVRAEADSLWVNDSSLFSDQKASSVGDIVLVRVSEEIKDSDEGKTKSSKSSSDNVKSGFGILNFIRAFGLGSDSTSSSNTKIERTKTTEMKISCLVVDVMPNGNLVIQGDRTLTSGAEKMNARFTGVVRRQDIKHDNSVESLKVANAEIVVSGRGIVSRTQRPGVISQILQAIF